MQRTKTLIILMFIALLMSACSSAAAIDEVEPTPAEGTGVVKLYLSTGTAVQSGDFEAVGTIPGCTATLITNNLVLTAAHCVCPNDWRTVGCDRRASFTLHDVFPVDNPDTATDESRARQDITLAGTVRVHPEYEQRGWLREDIAVVTLDRPITQVAPGVTPIPVEEPHNTPLPGDKLTIVGYGNTGADCSQPSKGKLTLTLSATTSNWKAIVLEHPKQGACPGDSGGPILNTAGRVVGVGSWIGTENGFVMGSTYRPTSYSYNWIFGVGSPSWKSLAWIPVETAGINSHAPYSWCPNGSFLVGFDLDGDRSLSPYDSPVVRQAQCATPATTTKAKWGSCLWVEVEQADINSHAPRPGWCPAGSFLVGFDLDGPRNISAKDAPVVGQVRCCTLASTNQSKWGSSYWKEVGAIASHNSGQPWCLNGAFLTQFDLDQWGPDARPDAYDAPIVGQAKCSRPRP